jgi:hypothetical protein
MRMAYTRSATRSSVWGRRRCHVRSQAVPRDPSRRTESGCSADRLEPQLCTAVESETSGRRPRTRSTYRNYDNGGATRLQIEIGMLGHCGMCDITAEIF